jgi:hypothetical protein
MPRLAARRPIAEPLEQPGGRMSRIARSRAGYSVRWVSISPANSWVFSRRSLVEGQLQRVNLPDIRPILGDPLVHVALQRLQGVDHQLARSLVVERKDGGAPEFAQLGA